MQRVQDMNLLGVQGRAAVTPKPSSRRATSAPVPARSGRIAARSADGEPMETRPQRPAAHSSAELRLAQFDPEWPQVAEMLRELRGGTLSEQRAEEVRAAVRVRISHLAARQMETRSVASVEREERAGGAVRLC